MQEICLYFHVTWLDLPLGILLFNSVALTVFLNGYILGIGKILYKTTRWRNDTRTQQKLQRATCILQFIIFKH